MKVWRHVTYHTDVEDPQVSAVSQKKQEGYTMVRFFVLVLVRRGCAGARFRAFFTCSIANGRSHVDNDIEFYKLIC